MTTNTVTTTTTDISLAKLIPSPVNVRRTGASSSIEALAASIQAHGLLQSIVVRPKLDGEGQAGGRSEVVAGGRRLAALKLLAKQTRITTSTAIPCRVLDADGIGGTEASLAENIVRQDMHPADQFEAFHGLHQGGIGIEDIAARFGVSAHTVQQRLRLASVSPALIQAHRDEELTLDHLTAFAVSEDTEAQERVFGQLPPWQRNPDTIRRLLTHALTPATDRKALFVGLDAYTAAGGTVQRDLFSETEAAGLPTLPCWSGLSRNGWSMRPRGSGRKAGVESALARKPRQRRGTCGGSGRTRRPCLRSMTRGAASWRLGTRRLRRNTVAGAITLLSTPVRLAVADTGRI